MTALLGSPFPLGPLDLQNRVVISPMCQYCAEEGFPTAWHSMHYGSLAVSGAGLVIVEATAVLPEGRISPNCLGLWSDDQADALAEMLSNIRSFSKTPFGIQIGHAGRKASAEPFDSGGLITPDAGGWQAVAPSAQPLEPDWPSPRPLDKDVIAEVIDAFVSAALRAVNAGFRLIELHGAHGYLLSSFLSPAANSRKDCFGGSLENRMRLPLAVARAVRAALPEDIALGMRINGTDHVNGGINISEAIALAKKLREEGLDYVTVSAGGNARAQQIPATVPGYQVALARDVRAASDLVTMTVGMIIGPEQAESILQAGEADLIAIGRAALDDPRWPRRAIAALDGISEWPRPWSRAAPGKWRGYGLDDPGSDWSEMNDEKSLKDVRR